MSNDIRTLYPGRVNPADANYPFGSIKNESVPGANDGTPLTAEWGNDPEALKQAALYEAGEVPNGVTDTAKASQMLNAIKKNTATVADIATGRYPVGRRLIVTDRYNGVFIVQSGGVADGYSVIPAGTGKTAIIDPSLNVGHVRWTGAKGDGVTNDRAAIQAAVDLFGIVFGSEEDTYLIDGDLDVPEGRTVDFNNALVLCDFASGNAFNLLEYTSRKGVRMRQMTIRRKNFALSFTGGFQTVPFGYKSDPTPINGAGIYCQRSTDASYGYLKECYNVQIEGFATGVDTIGYSSNQLNKVICIGCTTGIKAIGSSSNAVNAIDITRCNMVDCGQGYDLRFIASLNLQGNLAQRCSNYGYNIVGCKGFDLNVNYSEYCYPSTVRLDNNKGGLVGGFFYGNRFTFREFTVEGVNRFTFAGDNTANLTHNLGTTDFYCFVNGRPDNGISRTTTTITFSSTKTPSDVIELVTKQDIQSGSNYGVLIISNNAGIRFSGGTYEEMLFQGIETSGTGNVGIIAAEDNYTDQYSAIPAFARDIKFKALTATEDTTNIDSKDRFSASKILALRGRVQVVAPSGTDIKLFGGDWATDSAGKGIVVKTPDGSKTYRIRVDNAGAIAIDGPL